jgi:hypothetical protein
LAAISARQKNRLATLALQLACHLHRQRRFARTACGKITDADHR